MGRVEYLLGDILSSVIGRIRVDWSSMGFSYLPNPCFGFDELGLCLGCCEWTWAWREAHRAIGLVDGYLAYLFIPISCPPSPCVRIA